MGKKYILDTNVVLDFMGRTFPREAQDAVAKIIDDNLSVWNPWNENF